MRASVSIEALPTLSRLYSQEITVDIFKLFATASWAHPCAQLARSYDSIASRAQYIPEGYYRG
jgi:hypothetical protein